MAEISNARISDQPFGGSGSPEDAENAFGQQFDGSAHDNSSKLQDAEIFDKGDPCAS